MSTLTPSQPSAWTNQPAVLEHIDWKTYTRLLRVLHESHRFRITYDRGTVEILTPLLEHEGPGRLLGHFVLVLCEELNMPCRLGGSVTLRRRRVNRGVEPDNCFWIASAPRLLGRTHLDLRVDPPPDLAIEIDVTSSSVPRMPIYARLGVPEVWRLDGQGLVFHVLDGRTYRVTPTSVAFPGLTPAQLTALTTQQGQTDDLALIKLFRDGVRQTLVPPAP